jgi:Chalcone isomerase like
MRRLLTAVAIAALAAPAAAQTVNEPSSGVAFPVSMAVADGSTQVLLGTGLRTRTMLNVKVYAFGLYVDQAAARTALTSFAGRTAEQLGADQTFYAALLRMGFPMTMRLVMTRNVSGEQMSEAFDGALRPRVVAAAGRNMPGGEEALTTFRGYFSVDRLTEGAELVFTCTADGAFHSKVAGEAKPVINNRALCWALFDVYLGSSPISAGGKRTVVARTPEVLR